MPYLTVDVVFTVLNMFTPGLLDQEILPKLDSEATKKAKIVYTSCLNESKLFMLIFLASMWDLIMIFALNICKPFTLLLV